MHSHPGGPTVPAWKVPADDRVPECIFVTGHRFAGTGGQKITLSLCTFEFRIHVFPPYDVSVHNDADAHVYAFDRSL